jgi:hypothetical protein
MWGRLTDMKCQACTLMQLPRVTWTCTPAAQKLRAQQLHLVHGAERLPQHAPLALVLAGAHAVPLEGRVGLGPASSSAQAVPMRGAGGAWACTQQRAGCANGRRGRGLGLHPAARRLCQWEARAGPGPAPSSARLMPLAFAGRRGAQSAAGPLHVTPPPNNTREVADGHRERHEEALRVSALALQPGDGLCNAQHIIVCLACRGQGGRSGRQATR